ncbi:MAG TPA: hypothetical protein VFC73_02705 [Syntrophomonadaceae bacterium]|nr:hypothetical protein [Syntrophomonadaceae bacterium]
MDLKRSKEVLLMEYINLFLTPFIAAMAGAMATYIWGIPKTKKKEEEIKRQHRELLECRVALGEEALKALLRSDIQKAYDKAVGVGYITSYEKQNVSYLHKAYKKLTGNSYIDKVYDELMRLPVQVEKGKEDL